LDVSRFRIGDWVLVGAGGVMLILGLAVHWATIEAAGRSYGGARNAFDYPFTGGVAWLLVVAAGVVAFLLAGRLIEAGRTPWTRLILGAAALATLLMLLRVLLGGGADQHIGNQDVTLSRGAGMFIALLAAAAAVVGAFLNLRAEGDSLQAIYASLSTRARATNEPEGTGPLPPPNPGTPPPGDPPT
jgi:cellobiose-specific phosphotransferase system component IIC